MLFGNAFVKGWKMDITLFKWYYIYNFHMPYTWMMFNWDIYQRLFVAAHQEEMKRIMAAAIDRASAAERAKQMVTVKIEEAHEEAPENGEQIHTEKGAAFSAPCAWNPLCPQRRWPCFSPWVSD